MKKKKKQFKLDYRIILFFIILLGFLLRSPPIYSNSDSLNYILFLKYFMKFGQLPYFDHPPLFFILTALINKFISMLLSFNQIFYWGFILTGGFTLLYLLRKEKLHIAIILFLFLFYFGVTGFFFGIYEITTFVSFVSGVIEIYLVYLLGKEIFNERVGLVAAFLIAVSWWHIVYSQIPLIDGFATTAITWAVLEYFKFVKKDKISNKDFILPAISLTAAFYSKYFAILLIPSILLLVFLRKRKRFILSNLIPLILTLFVFSIWLFFTKFYLLKHYAITHYFFLIQPSKFAFINFFTKVLTLPIFLLFLISLFLVFHDKRKIEDNIFLLSLIFIPLIVYLKYTYVDGLSHSLINLSNYMLPTLPFILIICGFGWSFLENKVKKDLTLFLLGIVLFSILFKPGGSFALEYDKNYLAPYENLEMLSSDIVEIIPIEQLPTLHYAYNFVANDPLKLEKVPEKEAHLRWLTPDKLKIIAIENKKLDLTLFVRSLSVEDKLFVYFDDKVFEFERITREGKEITLSLNLIAGENIIEFKPRNQICTITIDNYCVNFIIQIKN